MTDGVMAAAGKKGGDLSTTDSPTQYQKAAYGSGTE